MKINDLETYDDWECALEANEGKHISVPVFAAYTHMVCKEDKAVNGCIMPCLDCDSIVEKMEKMGVDSIITVHRSGVSTDGLICTAMICLCVTVHRSLSGYVLQKFLWKIKRKFYRRILKE